MKIRQGFVSNSSSSSFVIFKYHLSQKQIDSMLNYVEVVEEYLKDNPLPESGYYGYDDEQPEYDFSYCGGWRIKNFDDFIFGETSMNNFDFSEFLRYIGVNDDAAFLDDGYNDKPTSYQEKYLERERKKLIKTQRKDKLNKLNGDEI